METTSSCSPSSAARRPRDKALVEKQRIAYIQTDADGRPYSQNGAAAARGFAALGYDVRYFRRDELDSLPLTPATVVVGGVGTVHAALGRVGTEAPAHVSVPAVLRPFLGRDVWRTIAAELREESHRFPLFVKPYTDSKVFNGRVVRNTGELDALLAPRPGFPEAGDDLPLLASELVAFRSEWRVFVVRGRPVGTSHYHGDPLLFPNPGVVRAALGAYRAHAPAGYSADFGVSDGGRTLLVEVNDGYALGNGGLVASLYAELLHARWREITERATREE